MKDKIVQCFNNGAATYDDAADVQLSVAKRLAQWLSPISAQRILEIGCGTGLFSRYLLNHFPKASLLLTDIAPQMVETSRKNFSAYSQIKVDCLDGEALTLAAQFDLIVSSMTLHWFYSVEHSLAAIIEQLTSRSRLIFSMLGENSLREWRELCQKHRIPVASPVFPSHEAIQKNFPGLELHVETVQQPYESIYAFLKTLKRLGAVASHENYVPLTPGKLRKILRHADEKIQISYEVIYGCYTKP